MAMSRSPQDSRAEAGQPVAARLGSKGHSVPQFIASSNSRGEISDGWKPAGPGVPAAPEAVEELLRSEGVRFPDGRPDRANAGPPVRRLILRQTREVKVAGR